MPSLADLLSVIRDDLRHRYRGLLAAPFLVALLVTHWRVLAYIYTESPKSKELIAFVESHVSPSSIALALASACVYVVAFPWLEHFLGRIASTGRRRRDEFQAQEAEAMLARRRVITEQQARLIESELLVKEKQALASDMNLAHSYQSSLPGEVLSRSVAEVEKSLSTTAFEGAMQNYISRSDHLEGQFISAAVEEAHQAFVRALAQYVAASLDWRSRGSEDARIRALELGQIAVDAQRRYRNVARTELRL
jgi:hypothetical protein